MQDLIKMQNEEAEDGVELTAEEQALFADFWVFLHLLLVSCLRGSTVKRIKLDELLVLRAGRICMIWKLFDVIAFNLYKTNFVLMKLPKALVQLSV